MKSKTARTSSQKARPTVVQAAKKPASTRKAKPAKAAEAKGKVKAQRVQKTGLTSRVRGHVSARGRRAQAKRDQ